MALKAVKNREEAEKLKSKAVFFPKKKFKTKKGEFIYLAELTGFCIEIPGKTQIGIIQSFHSNNTFQDLLLVKQKDKEVEILIPFVKSYILSIDFKTKKIVMDLPKDFLKTFSYTNKGSK